MASIEKRRNKAGEVISCIITVAEGVTRDGTQMRRRRTWKPEPGMTERQIEKAVNAAAVAFEYEVQNGLQLDNRQTFAEYADYVLSLKERSGVKPSTLERYRGMLPRINAAIGHLKLSDIRPQHLNAFYTALGREGERKDTQTATITPAAKKSIAGKRGAKAAIAKKSEIANTTVSAFFAGDAIRVSSAEAIAAAMGRKPSATYKVHKGAGKLSPKTILEHHRLISVILTQADKELLVHYNAAAKATPPKATSTEPNYFQPQDIQNILQALETEPSKWRVITHLLIVTGCRRGEIAGLKWEKVDFENLRLRIDTALVSGHGGAYESTTKTGNTRFLYISKETATILRQHRAEQFKQRLIMGDQWQDTGFVFTRDNGLPLNPDGITAWLGTFAKRHNLPHINPHAFRHSAASILIANGMDVVTVSKQLGHAKVSTTTNIYSHIIEENKVQAAECLADVILRSPKKRQA